MPFTDQTKGEIEAAISAAFTRFEREYLGRGPRDARTFILADLVLIRLQGILSPAEQKLGRESGGIDLIKQLRSRLIENASLDLAKMVEEATGAKVITMHTDISSRTGERIFVFGLDRNLEALLRDP